MNYYLIILFFLIIIIFFTTQYENFKNIIKCEVSDSERISGLDKYYDKSCITESGLQGGIGCVGQTGCRYCNVSGMPIKNGLDFIPCPTKIKNDNSLICTNENMNPYKSGSYVKCCEGTTKILNTWDNDDNYYYKCVVPKETINSGHMIRPFPYSQKNKKSNLSEFNFTNL